MSNINRGYGLELVSWNTDGSGREESSTSISAQDYEELFGRFMREDAPEEPKSYYFINTACDDRIIHTYGEPYEMQIETGNHFETREEAERAYEKLKAWKFGGKE